MSTRRRFVTLGAVSGAAALVPGGLAPGEAASGSRPSGTRARFASQVGRPFLVEDGGGGPVTLVLASVSDPGVRGGLAGHPECFSAEFVGPASPALRQGTHAVTSGGLGRLALFLVPVGRPRGGRQQYEAAFNCVVPA
jgi:hypothetical protein